MMATTLPPRSQAVPDLHERRGSISSVTTSHKSSLFSHTPAHSHLFSQSSLIPPSPRGPPRSLPTSGTAHVKHGAKIKSQYPLHSRERHVEYILVASFDIDRGPIMEHQYPGAISPDENMLAELMLPDQTHVRTQDWTMFFLHKDANLGEDESAEREERRERRRERRLAKAEADANGVPEEEQEEDLSEDESSSDEEEEDNRDGPPLMYVLNLVNTKHDSSVKRGAIVKAMAICTRHPFLHIYKPLLLLALEDYFKSPYPETLEVLYNAVNAMDLSLMPRLSLLERHIMQASDTKDMFVEKFEDMIRQRLDAETASGKLIEPESPSRQNGRYAVPRDTHEFESKIVYNGIPVPVKVPTALSPETVGDFSIVKLIQIFGNPHTTQPQPFALHPHLTTSGAYTHPVIVLINAMLTQKRVIFLAHNQPSGEVAEAVLAACALASGGVLRGFTRFAFPYTDLTKIDELLKVPGFIAGVTNPAFSYHPEWWDLLCDIPSGRMKISPNIEAAAVTEGVTYFQQNGHSAMSKDNNLDATGDSAFMDDVLRSIVSRHGEFILRAKFRAYITKFTRIAAAFEETVYGASALSVIAPTEVEASSPVTPNATKCAKDLEPESSPYLKGHGYVWPSEEAKHRELAASASRVEGWRNNRSYYTFISDLASHTKNNVSPSSPVRMTNMLAAKPVTPYLDIYHALSRLRTLRLLPSEAGAIYTALNAYCIDHDSILELLVMAPMSEASLFYVSLGLWHEDRRVREAVAELLDRIRVHAAGKHFYARLGGWVSMGLMRCMQEKEVRQTSKEDEVEVSMMDGMTRKRNKGRFS